MPTHVVIIYFFLMLIGLLFKTDGAIGTVAVESAEHILDDPFETIDDQKTDQQTLQLLMGVGSFVTFRHWRELRAFIFSHKYTRPQRQSHESLQRDILVIYYF